MAISVLAFASVLVLQFESASPDAMIKTGWDAFWYSVVTITTVGYGDYYPITTWGRVTAMFIMIAGVGIIRRTRQLDGHPADRRIACL